MTKIKESIDLRGFAVGEAYGKEDIVKIGMVSAPQSYRAGSWATGILPFGNAVLLLVTLDKDEEGYNDYFDGGEIHWQSQYRHSQNSALIQQLASGQSQAHLFARLRSKMKGKTQKFIYCGGLAWLSMERQYPVDCRFQLLDRPSVPNPALQALFSWRPTFPGEELGQSIVEATIAAGKQMAAVDTEKDARDLVQRAIAIRRGQKGFRTKLLKAYGNRCAVTGCAVVDILEAAHIVPYKGEHTHRVDNGLLLRADIHTLFDLGLIWISPQRTLQLDMKLRNGEYGNLHGEMLRAPAKAEDHPRLEHLAHHAKLAAEHRAGKSRLGSRT
ncbi:HNH endonuclease [Stenotrophomonas sp. PD6]|uniref:HNH endonuclease n=1 Tax=Stenotrophomonas sp. PD6 TaxID=3368612 RepID=UPI003B9EFE2D